MPGLFGLVGDNFGISPEMYLDKMAYASHDGEKTTRAIELGGRFGFGQVSQKNNPGPGQIVWSEDRNLCLMIQGELFDYAAEKQVLIERGHRFRSEEVAEFVLHLYKEYSDRFVERLNGTFVVAIWDQNAEKLVLANDRLGFTPLYYVHWNGNFAFAPNVQSLLSDPRLPRSTDPVSIAQYITFDHALGDRTILNNVRLLPPATILHFFQNQIRLKTYWMFQAPEYYIPTRETDLLEGLNYSLRRSVARQAPGEQAAGLLLSGGLDSRVLLALLADHSGSSKMTAFTFGIPGCDDARFAREASAMAGVRHMFLEMKPDYLQEVAEAGVRITSGLGNCVHMGVLTTVGIQLDQTNLLYKGFFGDALMGFFSRPEFFGHYQEDDLVKLLFNHYPILFPLSEHPALLTEEFQAKVQGLVYESCREALNQTSQDLAVNKMYRFDVNQRQRRLTLNGVLLARNHGVVRTPFCDYDLVDFMLQVPPGMRIDRSLMKKAFIHAYPKLGKVPVTETGLPMIDCARNLVIQAGQIIKWHVKIPVLKTFLFTNRRSYKDYNGWFRTILRAWVEEILLSKQALQRGYFNQAYIQQLVSEHMSGANHATKLGALLSLELWHKQFID